MENNGFNHLSDLWKKAETSGISQKKYSKEEINKLKMKNSLDFSKSINKAIVFDFVHKGILLLGMLLLIWFYRSEPIIIMLIAALITFAGYQIYRELAIRKELFRIEDYAKEISTVLKEKIDFYNKRFPALKWMLSFSNALLVWVGSMFYYYSKYGFYKIEDVADLTVAVLMVSLAFGMSYVAHSYQLRYNVLELQESLDALDDQVAASDTVALQAKRKKRFKLTLIVLTSLGILLFILFMLIYMNQLL